jgi:acetoin utilization deacetylase AcuC-like enzyme
MLNLLKMEVIYDKYQKKHLGNKTSLENPERIEKIVDYLKEKGLNDIINEYNVKINICENEWNKKKIFNCSSCTFILNNNICNMCNSIQTHEWNYINDIDGDTTYETKYTKEIVDRGLIIIKNSIDKLINGDKIFIFCLIRPPSHHACEGKRVGFCYKNLVIDALDYITVKYNKSVLILDIDAHHGDGTEKEILKREYGYYISIHGFGENIYPGTGKSVNNNRILNIAMNNDTSNEEWLSKFNINILSKIKEISPEIIILSCGLDGYYKDISSPLKLTENAYKEFSVKLSSLNIPILSVLEGGYYNDSLGLLAYNIIYPYLNT